MSVDFERMTCREYPDVPYTAVTPETILDFVTQVQPPPAAPGPAAVADTLLGEVRKLNAGQLPTAPTANFGYHTFDSVSYEMSGWRAGAWLFSNGRPGLWTPWYAPYCVPPWIFAWWRLRNRLVRNPAQCPAAP